MRFNHFLRVCTILAISAVPEIAHGDMVNGTVTGSTATAPALNPHPQNRDDANTSTTFNITFVLDCPFIRNADPAPGLSFVFAGLPAGSSPFAPPVGLDVTPISPSDFAISNYAPWVVDSNPAVNSFQDPSGHTQERGIYNQDAGGANIVISYTPQTGDPTSVNFLQAYSLSVNGGGFNTGTIDSGGGSSPYYNDGGVSGTGTSDNGGLNLQASPAMPAWIADIPGTCENGEGLLNQSCDGGADETIITQTRILQTFIESDKTCSDAACGANQGKIYHVLYGGVQWGYEYTNADPEPSYALLFAGLLTSGWLARRHRPHRRAA